MKHYSGEEFMPVTRTGSPDTAPAIVKTARLTTATATSSGTTATTTSTAANSEETEAAEWIWGE